MRKEEKKEEEEKEPAKGKDVGWFDQPTNGPTINLAGQQA